MTRREILLQGLGLGIAAAVLWWLGRNTMMTLEARGISPTFEFLGRAANFAIGDAPIPYDPSDSYGRAIIVGLANTARVSVLGWILSIALGFLVGVVRLSDAPALRGLARAFVELMRNTPLLLLLLLLAATMHALPSARSALEPLPSVFLSDRGLVLPSPALGRLPIWLGVALLVSLAARRRLGRAGQWISIAGGLALVAALIVDPPVWDVPRLRGFNFVGGLTLSPELAALLAALVLHHAANISEVVRGAILAVPRGQREAALAIGLSRFQVLRLVVVPQALRAMVPLLANNCVSLTKNSSLAVAIGFPDVVSVLNTTTNQTGHALETMVIMVAVYLVLSLVAAAALNSYNARVLEPGR